MYPMFIGGLTVIALVVLISRIVLLKKQEKSQEIPFGPYLGMAFLVYMFWGETLDTLMMGV